MDASDVLGVAVPLAAFGWCLFKLAKHPSRNYAPWRFVIGMILLVGICAGAFLLLRGDPVVAILGSLVAGLVALGASKGLIEKMEAREAMTAAEKRAQQAAADPLSDLIVPAVIGLGGLAKALIDQF
ncbi:MAG: hypothetical protein QOI10_1795 [Solirubrobacterales bacterium]|jgi:F0F1-type ATP synthase assembly protein I|nr:hypothetical protein [Solirubrobacterales bacterium]